MTYTSEQVAALIEERDRLLDGLYRVYVALGHDTDGARDGRALFGPMVYTDPAEWVPDLVREAREDWEQESDRDEAEIRRYRAAIEEALAFEAVLPAIATVPRRILADALAPEHVVTNRPVGSESHQPAAYARCVGADQTPGPPRMNVHEGIATGNVPGHDRDRMGICRLCGHGITAAEILDGERRCAPDRPNRSARECDVCADGIPHSRRCHWDEHEVCDLVAEGSDAPRSCGCDCHDPNRPNGSDR
ncbi:hypothetical protein ABE10_10560 [Bacillus toyonensis]|nr:hypothetical protein [Bacillus toyonensis]